MLAMNSYPKDYIDRCRDKVAANVAAYRAVAAKVGDKKALATFEPVFFNNLVLSMDAHFVHRTRAVEGKDGNPLNEVRVLCSSLALHDGVLTQDGPIRLKRETSVLGIELGERIAVREDGFVRLSAAFFAELESKFLG